jgi:hypothetical protein
MQIGQVGDFDGEGAGVKADRSARVVLGAWNHLRVDIHPDGWVRAYLNDQTAPAASYRFPAPAPGKAGCRAERAATYFDNFSAWYETVLP